MSEPLLKIERTGPDITVLTLNRPDKRNALNIALMIDICDAIAQTESIPNQRVIIIKGAGNVFCAGLDLAEASEKDKWHESAEMVAKLLTAVHTTPLVTIAVVQGAAIAGGAGLMSACDFAVADEEALFGYPEVHRGLVAAQVMSFLVRQLKQRDIRELLLLGELVDANKALSLGLVNRVVSNVDLMKEAFIIANKALRGAPGAIAATKKLLDEMHPSSFLEDLKKGFALHQEIRTKPEAQEGIKAFLERREPKWS